MDTFERELNELLIQTFRDILKVEELILERSAPRLSVSEVHLIEAIRKSKDRALAISFGFGNDDRSPNSFSLKALSANSSFMMSWHRSIHSSHI